ncbi:TPA: hypothetical protein RQK93_004596 [Vibrio vulnificus]|nr:hypothetical protein [Vibrio vulnificus]
MEIERRLNIRESFIEAVELYKKAGSLNRIFIMISFFLSVSSIASLSESIFKWKGFILDAVDFYQHCIAEIIINYAGSVGLSYTQNQVHSAVILSIAVSLGMKMFILDQLKFAEVMRDKYNFEVTPKINFFRIQAVAYSVFVWLSFGLSEDHVTLTSSIILLMSYPIFLSLIHWILVHFDKNKTLSLGNVSYCKAYYVYLAAIFFMLGVLGAINSGISKVA